MKLLQFPTPSEKCKLCERALGDEYADLKYEVFNEDGTTVEEVPFGKICWSCADVLDAMEEETNMAPDNDDDL